METSCPYEMSASSYKVKRCHNSMPVTTSRTRKKLRLFFFNEEQGIGPVFAERQPLSFVINVLAKNKFHPLNTHIFQRVRIRVTLRLTVSQSVSQSVCLGVEPTLGRLTRYCFLFKSLGLKFVVLSL
jgi:hypothetical protein